jgi:small-conductance mechanosensitive channel
MQENALERVLLPLSGLTSWLIVVAGGLSYLHVLGINVVPLLTVGGVSTILVGLSAQSVMANMIAGVNLVRPPALHAFSYRFQ